MTTCVFSRAPALTATARRGATTEKSATRCRPALPYPRRCRGSGGGGGGDGFGRRAALFVPRAAAATAAAAAAEGDAGGDDASTATAAPGIFADAAKADELADEDEDEDDAPPPISEAAARANASVEAAVASASADSSALAAASAPNAYLPFAPAFSLPLPPEPVRFPRAPLNIKLAVLLLRSGYETVDAMVRTGHIGGGTV